MSLTSSRRRIRPQHDAGADQRAEHEGVAGGEDEAEDERQVGEAERVGAAAEADVDDAELGAQEARARRPTRAGAARRAARRRA